MDCGQNVISISKKGSNLNLPLTQDLLNPLYDVKIWVLLQQQGRRGSPTVDLQR